ncbi:hypothetical protein GCM10027093_27390 [Paraburkholderia jirisanensis]
MNKAISTLIAASAALALSGGAYAQVNDTLATPTIVSATAHATSGYGTPGIGNQDGGVSTGAPNSRLQKNATDSSTSGVVAYGVNNTLARPSVVSPVARK